MALHYMKLGQISSDLRIQYVMHLHELHSRRHKKTGHILYSKETDISS